MIHRPACALVGMFAIIISVFGLSTLAGAEEPHPPHVLRPTAGAAAPLPLAATGGEDITAALTTWAEGITREHERLAADTMAATGRSTSGPSVAADATGACEELASKFGLSPAILWRESRCSTDAYNGTGCGGRGCVGAAQLDLGHFEPVSPWNPKAAGSCSDLDPGSLDDQAECASRLSPSAWGG